ncbi:MAG: fatty acid desaturase [Bdellovibrionales bacterium]|nr:fatty acid desaturase [Bdellovibrionales bacterium]
MKSYPAEHQIASQLSLKEFKTISETQMQGLREFSSRLHQWQKRHPILDGFLTLAPLLILSGVWGVALSLGLHWTLMSLIHGFVAYSWVVYSLHECAGHGVRNDSLRYWIGQSSRLWMADPEYYREFHLSHHTKLGTNQDGTFTHAVGTVRLLKSLLPFSGILFPNDYKVHMGGPKTRSQVLSMRVGLAFVVALSAVVCATYESANGFWVTLVFGPWVSFVLDRLRESIEHQLMPQDRTYGAREIGWTFAGQIVAGGPWGQPFHFTHHLAPGLPWYLQVILAGKSRRALLHADAQHPVLTGNSAKMLRDFVENQRKIYRQERIRNAQAS